MTEEQRDARRREVAKASYLRHREKRVADMRARRLADPERTREEDRRNTIKNKAPGSDYQKRRYAKKDKAKAAADLKEWKKANPDKVREHWDRTYAKNKEKHSAKSTAWGRKKRAEGPEFQRKKTEINRQWRARNREKMREYYRMKSAERRLQNAGDVNFRMMASIRTRIRNALNGAGKGGVSTAKLLGASIVEVRAHIEARFIEDMTWDNWGRGWGGRREWHLDHVRPLASFDLTDPAQLALACHYTNLQPLWAIDNLKKGAIHGRSLSGESES